MNCRAYKFSRIVDSSQLNGLRLTDFISSIFENMLLYLGNVQVMDPLTTAHKKREGARKCRILFHDVQDEPTFCMKYDCVVNYFWFSKPNNSYSMLPTTNDIKREIVIPDQKFIEKCTLWVSSMKNKAMCINMPSVFRLR